MKTEDDLAAITIYRLQGYSFRRIAREVGCDRRTVKKYIEQPERIAQRSRPSPRSTILNHFETYIAERFNAGNVNVASLFRDLKSKGYLGSYPTLQKYMYQLPRIRPRVSNTQAAMTEWIVGILQGNVGAADIYGVTNGALNLETIQVLLRCAVDRPLRYRNRALTILLYSARFSQLSISRCLCIGLRTVRRFIQKFNLEGAEALLSVRRKATKKCQDITIKEALFTILHSPPSEHGINRTTWRMSDMHSIMAEQGHPISRPGIRQVIADAGYRMRKARKVLTSRDPCYKEKVAAIVSILSNLSAKEKFFSIDEFGPFAVQIVGGRSLVAPGEIKTVPQWQRSKGSLLISGALELSTNQITHFYSDRKNTDEMIKLLRILYAKSPDEVCIYLSWDAASWHASKQLSDEVKAINSQEYKAQNGGPIVKLAPLPSGSQFLNVIESVYSGMARAIIHNSNYDDVTTAKAAIDRHFDERNKFFREHPKRAGNKIWGEERVPAVFREGNNCKDPKY